jgi:hypothetical protein
MKHLKKYGEKVNEALGGSAPDRLGSKTQFYWEPGKIIRIPGNLFGNSVDKVDTNSEEFKKAVEMIKNQASNLEGSEISITGGASAVGSDKGYDNEALAKRRAENFIKALKDAGANTTGFKPFGRVGTSKVKDSPEAKKEQFVEISWYKPSTSLGGAVDVGKDNATALIPIAPYKQKPKPVPIVDIDPITTEYSIYKVRFPKGQLSKVTEALEKAKVSFPQMEIINVSNDYNKKKYQL